MAVMNILQLWNRFAAKFFEGASLQRIYLEKVPISLFSIPDSSGAASHDCLVHNKIENKDDPEKKKLQEKLGTYRPSKTGVFLDFEHVTGHVTESHPSVSFVASLKANFQNFTLEFSESKKIEENLGRTVTCCM